MRSTSPLITNGIQCLLWCPVGRTIGFALIHVFYRVSTSPICHVEPPRPGYGLSCTVLGIHAYSNGLLLSHFERAPRSPKSVPGQYRCIGILSASATQDAPLLLAGAGCWVSACPGRFYCFLISYLPSFVSSFARSSIKISATCEPVLTSELLVSMEWCFRKQLPQSLEVSVWPTLQKPAPGRCFSSYLDQPAAPTTNTGNTHTSPTPPGRLLACDTQDWLPRTAVPRGRHEGGLGHS